ncbi:TetR/AcrR family transcriptional regulator [Kribbella capetownensis]|uniref:TetR/AcrR family transcriptional regulator n=1 Tax=Kribbella capetownensis TaxID=1572659 RepID=A0A4R0J6J7_9ACTN|nr:TetR family transcriptional regulator [Kribbella capetownensis]TCC40006.1 TetR/AcrR family transcriptional regulator [Kribbella capetownensis]
MTTFQRARSEEQRAVRREAILATAAAMLAEMPVSDVSLNELSRRVGLAKSNVLKYFESREAVLLELNSSELAAWVEDLATALAAVPPDASADQRAEVLVDAIVSTLAGRPVFCDLISTQASVLERNISTETAIAFKRAAAVGYERMVELTVGVLPEIGEEGARRFIPPASMLAGAVWTHAHPTPALLAAFETDPSISALRMEFEPTLRQHVTTLLQGVLPRSA